VKRLSITAALVLAIGVIAATASAAGSSKGLTLTKGKTSYPTKTYILSLPSGRTLLPQDVSVTENGKRVSKPKLIPASRAAKKTFGIVLVLDTSYSMNGAPLQAAVIAEQAFASHRKGNQELGAINFNHSVTPVLPLTDSATKISSALSTAPKVDVGTHIYDAVANAEAMLTAAGIGSGSIVVLSDGADHTSTKTLPEVAQTARTNHIRIYTVGLSGPTFSPKTLQELAAAGHGSYAPAKSTEELQGIFNALGQQISSQYLIQYTSPTALDKHVLVKVDVNGVGTKFDHYQTPPPTGSSPTAPPYHRSIGDRVWGSALTMILLALLAAAVVAFLLIAILQPRRSNLPARMAEFISIRDLQRDKGEAQAAADEATATGRKDWWARFEETLEIAEIKTEPEWIVAGTIAGTLLTFLLIYLATNSVWWALLAFTIPYFVREWVLRTLARRRNKFAEQLPDALQVIGSALRSGHSFAGALAVVVESASEPMKSEMQRVVADEQLGVPIQDSLNVVAVRMASRDVEQLALVAQLQREAGGDAAEVIDTVAGTVRERFDLKRLIHTLTMQGRMSRWIVSALPIVVILAVKLENPTYFHPLTSTLGGRIVLILAAAWAIAGSFAIKKIVEIEV
jgi:tight adherence protein B